MENFKENQNITFKQGERDRSELELPQLHFITMDNWIDVIGEKAFMAWLKMFTWTDRTGAKDNPALWNESKIPTSLNKLRKKLKVGNDTFYNQIIKPLWNVGLIDIEEFEESEAKGNKPLNIIVYKYPQNKFELSVKPLEMVRDYDKDYSSAAKTFAIQNAEKRQEKKGCSEIEQGVVPNENKGLFSDRTRGCSEIEHNNNLNPITNTPNSINNTFNHINKNLNLNPSVDKYDILWDTQIPVNLKNRIKVMMANNQISLSAEQILDIENAYHYQIQKSYIDPNCDFDYSGALNDMEFSNTVIKMLETVQDIKNIRGLIKEWVLLAFEHKNEILC